jgi:serine/threonine protein kinase
MGVVHRDIKCANVLVTDAGAVQLCDFGVAGVLRGQFEKRSTVTGTLQWMAPELFDERVSYGKEVDVWAFGSMAFEAATGLPPNATEMMGVGLEGFGDWLRRNSPRLEGDGYSEGLKALVRSCLVPEPAGRPSAEELLGCGYFEGTEETHPTEGLAGLVRAYRRWKMEGGEGDGDGCGWNYGTVDEADQGIYDHAMANVDTVPTKVARPRRRRRMPVDLRARVVKPPLEKAFDPNAISNYRDYARVFYGADSPVMQQQDNYRTIRESPVRTSLPSSEDIFPTMSNQETIKPASRSNSYDKSLSRFGTSRTQDWTFPALSPPPGEQGVAFSSLTQSSNGLFISNPPSPESQGSSHSPTPTKQRNNSARISTMSLIDLDASLPAPIEETGLSMMSRMTVDPATATMSNNTFEAAFSSAFATVTPPSDKED